MATKGEKKILIADDEPNSLETLRQRLEFEGLSVVTATDGEETLKKVKEDKIALLLLDVMMPKVNGYQVCRELKQDPETKNIPIVLLTAKAQESDKFWGKETGADDYVTKPYDLDELIKKIEVYLG